MIDIEHPVNVSSTVVLPERKREEARGRRAL